MTQRPLTNGSNTPPKRRPPAPTIHTVSAAGIWVAPTTADGMSRRTSHGEDEYQIRSNSKISFKIPNRPLTSADTKKDRSWRRAIRNLLLRLHQATKILTRWAIVLLVVLLFGWMGVQTARYKQNETIVRNRTRSEVPPKAVADEGCKFVSPVEGGRANPEGQKQVG